ncbi:hypothetical protein [Flavobacterium channae]|uniref:hypothetical protein n=1 Tax=Flavobacterium channae TaxID=2897181 RepID=UPI001E552C54|nr:hypothetical protein [Flavobacterium channae]UGS23394.1 hypothetical protein LOS89_11625 [Flavobacterium channae]
MKTIKRVSWLLGIFITLCSCTKEEIVDRETIYTPLESVAISDGANWAVYSNYGEVSDNLIVSGLEGRTNEIELKLKASVYNLNNLDFYLISPSNQVLPLMGNMIQYTPSTVEIDIKLTDNGPLTFDDWTQSNNMTGNYFSFGDISSASIFANQVVYDFDGFNDQNPNGQWRVVIREKALNTAIAEIRSAELFVSTKY